MTEPITGTFKCNQCGASYNSEHELLEHQQAAHHAVVSDLKPNEKDSVNPETKARAKNA